VNRNVIVNRNVNVNVNVNRGLYRGRNVYYRGGRGDRSPDGGGGGLLGRPAPRAQLLLVLY
jgi:hypothetical protein